MHRMHRPRPTLHAPNATLPMTPPQAKSTPVLPRRPPRRHRKRTSTDSVPQTSHLVAYLRQRGYLVPELAPTLRPTTRRTTRPTTRPTIIGANHRTHRRARSTPRPRLRSTKPRRTRARCCCTRVTRMTGPAASTRCTRRYATSTGWGRTSLSICTSCTLSPPYRP